MNDEREHTKDCCTRIPAYFHTQYLSSQFCDRCDCWYIKGEQ